MGLLRTGVLFVALAYVACASLDFTKMKRMPMNKALKSQVHTRARRSLYDFKKMIHCETGRSWMDFNGYGCFCGKGGKGVPVDDMDQCCYEHDSCYDKAAKTVCPLPWQIYLDFYWYNNCSDCDASKNTKCEQALCECDSRAAKCFKNNKWNKEYDDYPKDKC